ncbi:hypothetical protein L873DRAFT_1791218 [Choiromyces venosus 120613-1]|uniref:Uncharacterized protein n=1 Tax=Choiromyces venosus 120613-1 TaxID=1336337 RepID=A0A3N4JJN3_9PEZI|nr:hypothetical protein L873DRAFT_1791218 [Choiromyces venosus 120613-1]
MTKTRERNIITPRRSDRISKRSSDKRSCFKEAISISSDSSDDDCVVAGYGGSPKYISPDSPGDDDSPVGSSEDNDGDWGTSEGEELEPELVGEGDWGKESEEDDEDEDIRRPVKRARLSQQVSGCGKSPFHRQSRSNMSGSGTAEQVESHSDARIGTPAEQPYLVGEVTESLELTVSRANLGLDMEDGTDGNKSLSAEDR